ncbi:MAG: ribonuclease III, partial [Bacilli bacterium]
MNIVNLSKYGIKNNELFNVALTHTSYANENGGE